LKASLAVVQRDLKSGPPPVWTKKNSEAVGVGMVNAINAQTTAGFNADDSRFRSYSTDLTYISKSDFPAPRGGVDVGASIKYVKGEGYKGYKESLGTSTRGGSSVGVNLTKSGEMMRSLGIRHADAKGCAVGVSDAMLGRAMGNEAKGRVFLAVSKRMLTEIDATVQEVIDGWDILGGVGVTRTVG